MRAEQMEHSLMAPVTELLREHNLFRTTYLDEARSEVARVFCPHALTTTQKDEKLNTVHNRITLGDVTLNYLDYGAEVRITPGELNSFYLIQIPLKGSAEISCGKDSIHSDITTASIPNPLEKLDMVWHAGNPQLMVYINRATLEKRLEDLIGREIHVPVKFDLGMDLTTQKAKSWRNLIDTLVSDVDHEGLTMHAGIRNQFQDLIITGLLLSQKHNYSESIGTSIEPITSRSVRLAMAACEANPQDPLTVTDMARYAGVSIRSLQDGFKKYVGMSPTDYLRNVRLNRVREELLAERSFDSSIADIAFTWGFTHLGRFAKIYHERFGELPSETIRK
ncbi:MAG: helix-turn-helix domain-containing protein [Actinobacteria bacterium]|nr:helix-turn-helix domain-containing protein [Actinomycetota bacterium]